MSSLRKSGGGDRSLIYQKMHAIKCQLVRGLLQTLNTKIVLTDKAVQWYSAIQDLSADCRSVSLTNRSCSTSDAWWVKGLSWDHDSGRAYNELLHLDCKTYLGHWKPTSGKDRSTTRSLCFRKTYFGCLRTFQQAQKERSLKFSVGTLSPGLRRLWTPWSSVSPTATW